MAITNNASSQQMGFTLIELIMVIVILGILSAFALPKFADLSGSANTATVEGARAAIKSGAAIVHAKWLADGSTGTTVALEGATVNITTGYPSQSDLSNVADIAEFVQTDATTAGYRIITTSKADGSPCFTYADGAPPTISAVATYAVNAAGDADDTCS